MDELQLTCVKFFAFSNISMYCYSNEAEMLFHFPEYYSDLREDFVKDCMAKMDASNPERHNPLILTMDSRYHFAVIPLPHGLTLLAGPVSPNPDRPIFLPIYKNFTKRQKTLHMSYEKFLNAISIFVQLSTGRISQLSEFITMEAPAMDIQSIDSLPERNIRISYTGEALEQRLMLLIEKGHVEELKAQLELPSYITIENMSSNPLQHQKYLFIIFMTMAVRAATKGGLDDEIAFGIVGRYCLRMDYCTDVKEITSLIYNMGLTLCREVNKYKFKPSLTPAIRKCCTFISSHLYSPLDLVKLAGAANMSTRNFSYRFYKEMGTTPMAYVQSARIEEAKFLLRFATYSLLEISTALNYSSQSHFTSVFRRVTGMTPKQFQENNV